MEQEQNPIAGTVAYLKALRERLDATIETLEMVQASGGAIPAMTSQAARPSATGSIDHDTFFQMTVPDAAEKFLTLVKKTKTTAEVADGLLKGGLKSAAKNFPSMLNTILTRDSRFVRVNREWGLESWYPGMKRGPRKVPQQSAAEATRTESRQAPSKKEEPPVADGDYGFSSDSLRGRVLALLRSEPTTKFDGKTVSGRLDANGPSVNAALSALLGMDLIARPEKGRYQAK